VAGGDKSSLPFSISEAASTPRGLSSAWRLTLEEPADKFTITVLPQKTDLAEAHFVSLEGVKLFRQFSVTVDLAAGTFTPEPLPAQEPDLMGNLARLVKQEKENIASLISEEESFKLDAGLGFALHRLAELHQIHFEYLKNPYYLWEPTADDGLKDFAG